MIRITTAAAALVMAATAANALDLSLNREGAGPCTVWSGEAPIRVTDEAFDISEEISCSVSSEWTKSGEQWTARLTECFEAAGGSDHEWSPVDDFTMTVVGYLGRNGPMVQILGGPFELTAAHVCAVYPSAFSG